MAEAVGDVALAFLLTLIAGLSTGIGGLIALFSKTTNKKFLSVSLGFSAGVMIYVSMIEIFPQAVSILAAPYGEKTAVLITIIAFFAGMLFIALIDKLVPSESNPHEMQTATASLSDDLAEVGEIQYASAINKGGESGAGGSAHASAFKELQSPNASKLMRTGLFTALAIAIHNFPEGLATFVSALQDATIAIPIVVAIAIHNIPEGLAVAVPIYHATGSKRKALLYSFASGLAEPVGALIGFAILLPFLNEMIFGVVFAIVAGIMVFISIDELLPSAQAYGEHHLSIYGLVAGMAVMALSLWLFI